MAQWVAEAHVAEGPPDSQPGALFTGPLPPVGKLLAGVPTDSSFLSSLKRFHGDR